MSIQYKAAGYLSLAQRLETGSISFGSLCGELNWPSAGREWYLLIYLAIREAIKLIFQQVKLFLQ